MMTRPFAQTDALKHGSDPSRLLAAMPGEPERGDVQIRPATAFFAKDMRR
jgi:hypothetical protein